MGCLVDSAPYRIVNDTAFRRQLITQANKSNKDGDLTVDDHVLQRAKQLAAGTRVSARTRVYSFVLALLTFTPTNLGILCFFSGMVGGCCSRLTYTRLVEEKKISETDNAVKSANPPESSAKSHWTDTRLFYLSEPPLTAAFRSFVVYLFILAGIYLAAGDPFKDLTSSEYLRLAGLISAIAFAVGYDPSRFTELLNYLPKPGAGKP
jgi:hypothetical protein